MCGFSAVVRGCKTLETVTEQPKRFNPAGSHSWELSPLNQHRSLCLAWPSSLVRGAAGTFRSGGQCPGASVLRKQGVTQCQLGAVLNKTKSPDVIAPEKALAETSLKIQNGVSPVTFRIRTRKPNPFIGASQARDWRGNSPICQSGLGMIMFPLPEVGVWRPL